MRVFVMGGRDQARLAHNILRKDGHTVPYVYDQDRAVSPPWDCVLFHDENQIEKYARMCDAFLVCMGDVGRGRTRTNYSRQLEALGLIPISAIHPTSFLGDQVNVGKGFQAMPHAVVNDFSVIGDYCILGINCSVDHDCRVGDGVHIMGGAALAGVVEIGN